MVDKHGWRFCYLILVVFEYMEGVCVHVDQRLSLVT